METRWKKETLSAWKDKIGMFKNPENLIKSIL